MSFAFVYAIIFAACALSLVAGFMIGYASARATLLWRVNLIVESVARRPGIESQLELPGMTRLRRMLVTFTGQDYKNLP